MKSIVRVMFSDGSEAIVRDDMERSMCIVGNGVASQLIRRSVPSCKALKELIDNEGVENCQISTDYDEHRGVVIEGQKVYVDRGGVTIEGTAHFTGIGHLPWVANCMNGNHRLFF